MILVMPLKEEKYRYHCSLAVWMLPKHLETVMFPPNCSRKEIPYTQSMRKEALIEIGNKATQNCIYNAMYNF
jgi:cyanate permease